MKNNREIVVDNFAGGGGASTGIEMAIGRSVDIAINHDPNAIAMHTTNHPGTLHYCESVFDVDPVAATAGRPVGLAWFSPDCTHFSKARGSAPVKKEIRGLAWIVLRWALAVRPRVMMLENVAEFKTWGPLLTDADGTRQPDPARSGETFAAFVGMLSDGVAADHPALAECCEFLGITLDSEPAKRLVRGLGYAVEHRELRADNYGTPQRRTRFFMIIRCDGQPITWPKPTHGDPKSSEVQRGRLKPWRTAADCIDWAIPSLSIFERKKPLADNTLRRVAKGLWRHVLTNSDPFIVTNMTGHQGVGIGKPVLTPFITEHANASNQRTMSIDEPVRTLCAQVKGGHFSVVAPTMIPLRVTASAAPSALTMALFEQANGGFYDGDGHAADTPISTLTASGSNQRLVTAYAVKYYGTGDRGQSADEPMHTITTKDRIGVVSVVTVPADCLSPDLREKARCCAELLHKFLPEHFVELVEVVLMAYRDTWYALVDITLRMLQPLELYAAQGFPDWYVIDMDYRGVRHTKTAQVARCGNAVPPQFSEALVRANLPEICTEREEVAA